MEEVAGLGITLASLFVVVFSLCQVQNLIERCLQLYMNQSEVITTLQYQAKIEPGFTSLGEHFPYSMLFRFQVCPYSFYLIFLIQILEAVRFF